MSRGLLLAAWRPAAGVRSLSLLSAPPSSPRSVWRSVEDKRAHRASATCRTWDGPLEKKDHKQLSTCLMQNINVPVEEVLRSYHLQSDCTRPECPSQSSLRLCGTRSVNKHILLVFGDGTLCSENRNVSVVTLLRNCSSSVSASVSFCLSKNILFLCSLSPDSCSSGPYRTAGSIIRSFNMIQGYYAIMVSEYYP